ncbi:MAG: gliding motility lipoprotein GldH [Bacteroidales bacterium]|nr:gliding motility lipoprotein GldH [Bacteroidales bacterium]
MKTPDKSRLFGKSLFWIGCIWGCLAITACQHDTVLNKTFDTPRPAWAFNDPVCFNLTVIDTLTRYDLTFSLKHSEDYAWMNAFFLITTVFPDMNTAIDTLECILATPDGKWIGSRLGKYRNLGFLYKQNIAFPQAGEYRFEVRHAMRNDTLREIEAVGMKISRS